MFTTCTIIASAILYREWSGMRGIDTLGSVLGFLTIIIGVFLLHGFKDIKLTLGAYILDFADRCPNKS